MPGPKYPNAQTESQWFNTILRGLGEAWSDAALKGHWWVRAAMECIASGHAQLITSRDSTVVYMLRCWLSPPKPCTVGQHAKYESGNAVLLHWILQPDDIPHLHNHPWSFKTRILAGGYTEEYDGRIAFYDSETNANMGPGVKSLIHRPGDTVLRDPDCFHRIASHLSGPGDPSTGQGGTWSLVTTGPRVQPWSFLIDGHAVDAEGFLRAKRDQEHSLP